MPVFTEKTRENMLKVRNAIDSMEKHRFTMREWGRPIDLHHSCNTSACIGGWAEALLFKYGEHPLLREIGMAMGMAPSEADELFFSEMSCTNLDILTQRDAVRHLDLILGGMSPDWAHVVATRPDDGVDNRA